MRISSIDAEIPQTLATLLTATPHLPYNTVPGVSPAAGARLLLARIRTALQQGGILLAAWDGKTPSGLLAVAPLPFDTDLFGRQTARVVALVATGASPQQVAYALLTRLQESLPTLETLHAKVSLDAGHELRALEQAGLRTMAGWIDYGRTLADLEEQPPPTEIVVRLAEESDVPALEEIAGEAFTFDRFHADPRLPNVLADELHRRWVRNSVVQGLAQCVWVAEDEKGAPAGFLTCNVEDEHPSLLDGVRVANVLLNATRADQRGRGVYRTLLCACLNHCRTRADYIHAETQTNNLAVQRVWLRHGLVPIGTGLCLHGHRADWETIDA